MAQHEIQIRVADGKVTCVPDEVTGVKPGDTLKWVGPSHTGRFVGKVKGSKTRGFTLAELKNLSVAGGGLEDFVPLNRRAWRDGEVLTVNSDAASGSYKYDITVHLPGGDVRVDPIVIIDD